MLAEPTTSRYVRFKPPEPEFFLRFSVSPFWDGSTGSTNAARLGAAVGLEILMQFTKRLRDPIASGAVTCSVRIWQSPRVKVGGRYRVGLGAIEVTSIHEIELSDITPALARRSGFAGVVDLLKVAKHGPGEHVYLIEFTYVKIA